MLSRHYELGIHESRHSEPGIYELGIHELGIRELGIMLLSSPTVKFIEFIPSLSLR